MPRSYRYDYFTIEKPERAHRLREGEAAPIKEEYVPTEGVRYGKRFKETAERYHSHEEERKFEELTAKKKATAAKAAQEPPIGAVPAEEVPPVHSPSDGAEQAVRSLRAMGLAVRDFARAGMRLMLTPLEVARVLAERTRARKAY